MSKRKSALLVLVLAAAGAGVAWYLRVDAPTGTAANTDVAAPAARAPQSGSPHQASAVRKVEGSAHDALEHPGVVGVPFKLSASVTANCQRSTDCEELDVFLEQMAAEPRDAEWARNMEARIERAVMAGERGKFRIRSLECRSTRCALEVASEVDRVGLGFDSDRDFDEMMFPRGGYFANENDPQTGIATLVSAQTWQTWKSFDAEKDRRE
ncbi:MAG TPA: hypothetical protein VGO61_08870 [Steroidobacteraceae bacterium]|jgi:hypothetical protein|nr:hypothetical protein [Steroidobacteraceae bacterium]